MSWTDGPADRHLHMLDATNQSDRNRRAADRSHPQRTGGGPQSRGHLNTHWHTCGVCEPSRGRGVFRSRLVRAGGPEWGAAKSASTRRVTPVAGSWLVKALRSWSPIGWRVTVNLASVLVSVEVVAARCVGCLGIPSSRPHGGGDMKPYGHDHRELTHVARPHQVVGHADAASCPVAVARSHAASWRGSGSRRRAARRRRASTGGGRRRHGRCCGPVGRRRGP